MNSYTEVMKTRFQIALTSLILLITSAVMGQDSQNLIFLKSVPQSNTLNAASDVPYNFWIGIPGLSSMGMGFENTAFRYKDVVYRTSDDSLHFDVDKFLLGLDKANFLNVNFNEEILAFGFHIKRFYLDFRAAERFTNSIQYSQDMMAFLLKLNGQYIGKTAEFGGTGINMNLYHEFSMGIGTKLNDHWSVGMRLKFLSGVANIYSKKTDISLFTDAEDAYALTVHSDIMIHTSLPGVSQDPTDSLKFNVDGDQVKKELSYFRNRGYAIDLGVQFQPNDKLLFGFSMNDLGFIRWNNNPKSIVSDKQNHDFTFQGIDLNEFIRNDSNSMGKQLQKVLDTLSSSLGLKANYDPYTSYLVTQLNFTGQYNLTLKDHFGLLLRGSVFNRIIRPLITLHYDHEFGRTFNVMTGYTLSKGNYKNIALGFSVKFGHLQWYMMSDNAYAFFFPTDFKNSNFHFGFNLVFRDRRLFDKAAIEEAKKKAH
jgi:hypothetical protein